MNLRVDFYLLPVITLQESFKYASALAEKSYLSGQRTFMWTNSKEDAMQLNQSLWTFRDISFVPHALFEHEMPELPPVLIGFENVVSSGDILINLTPNIPDFFKKFNRVIELVPDETQAVSNSRKNYRIYRENQCELFSHNLKTPKSE